MVYVANLLRFRGWNGDFYIFSLCNRNFAISGDNLRAEPIFFANSASWADLLLYDVALSVAGVAYGDLFDELARSGRIFTRNDWNSEFSNNLRGFRSDFAIFLQNA